MSCENCLKLNTNTKSNIEYYFKYNITEQQTTYIVNISVEINIEDVFTVNSCNIDFCDFVKFLTDIKNEFMFKNPFFSNKNGVIEYNHPQISMDYFPQKIKVFQVIIIDKTIYTETELEKILKIFNK